MEILDEEMDKGMQVAAEVTKRNVFLEYVWGRNAGIHTRMGLTQREVKRLFEICKREGLL